jgi:hypothetical protein
MVLLTPLELLVSGLRLWLLLLQWRLGAVRTLVRVLSSWQLKIPQRR